MPWPWQRWRQRQAQRNGRFAACFEPYRGEEWVALDLETTGLDPRVDEILSIAAVRGDAQRLRLRERLELTVRSRSERIADSTRHHQLRPVDVHDAL
ncbi:MAG: exonuclease domain-containing protein, partial [Lysobacteraceae bacterium]